MNMKAERMNVGGEIMWKVCHKGFVYIHATEEDAALQIKEIKESLERERLISEERDLGECDE